MIPRDLQLFIGAKSKVLAVPRDRIEHMAQRHPSDQHLLPKLEEILERWEFVGQSPKIPNRYEVYSFIDGVTIATVIKVGSIPTPILNTMFRTSSAYLKRLLKKGYLKERGVRS